MAPLLLTLGAAASAFPGLIVYGAVSSPPTVDEARVVVVVEAERSVVTVFHTIASEPDRFGVLFPVPAATELAGVHDVDASAWNVVRDYTGPATPLWSCEEGFHDYISVDPGAWGAPGTPTYAPDAYSHEILTAADAPALLTALADRGLDAPDGAEAALEPYTTRGDAFLLVWRDTSAAGEYRADAFQFEVPTNAPSLAFELGALASPGWQMATVVVFAPLVGGRTSAVGWTETEYATNCMWPAGHDSSLEDWFEEYRATVLHDAAPAYAVDFAWEDGGCDPCADDPLDGDELATFGLRDKGPYFATRMTFGYEPAGAAPAALAATGDATRFQGLYLSAREEAEEMFPMCGEELDGDGTCGDTEDTGTRGDPPIVETDDDTHSEPPPAETGAPSAPKGCGCASTPGPVGMVSAFGIVLLAARRRTAGR